MEGQGEKPLRVAVFEAAVGGDSGLTEKGQDRI